METGGGEQSHCPVVKAPLGHRARRSRLGPASIPSESEGASGSSRADPLASISAVRPQASRFQYFSCLRSHHSIAYVGTTDGREVVTCHSISPAPTRKCEPAFSHPLGRTLN